MRSDSRAAGQEGFTLVEVLVAALVLVTAALGAGQVMISSTKVEFRAEQSQIAIDRAQAELEQMHSLGYEGLALTAAPSVSQAGELASRLFSSCTNQGVSSDGCFALNENGSNRAPLVVNGGTLEGGGTVSGGAVSPVPEQITTSGVSLTVHRFVVWQNDPSCDESQCPGQQDRKRAVVVVTIADTASGGERAYREVQSDFVDPDLGKDTTPTPTPPREVEAQQLYLSDTRCSATSRQLPVADHTVHNTTGSCADGAGGAPDLLLTGPPDLDPGYPANAQPQYDFATDVEPAINPGLDRGLQLRREVGAGCNFDPTGAGAEQRIHRWVTEEIDPGEMLVLEGTATLDFWTQTLPGAAGSATLCLFPFVRAESTGGPPFDTLIENADTGASFFALERTSWPQGDWSPESLTLNLKPPGGESNVRVFPGERLGLAISVASTSALDAVQIAYEHPDFESRLEIVTSTPLPEDFLP